MLKISSKFYPVRVIAFTRNETEMDITIENEGKEICWVEADIALPEGLSLASDRSLRNGRLRVGIIFPDESRTARCKIYAGSETYPSIYNISIVGYAYGKDGMISGKSEARADLRCARIGERQEL
ncbi:MAG: hypothetical protein QW112_03200 [Candidatus Micrarchaeia archaeon]